MEELNQFEIAIPIQHLYRKSWGDTYDYNKTSYYWGHFIFKYKKWERFKEESLGNIEILNILRNEEKRYFCVIKEEGNKPRLIEAPEFLRIKEKEVKEMSIEDIEKKLWYSIKIVK